jgi:hypothetical protein
MTVPPFTQLEPFSHGLKSTKVNFHLTQPPVSPDLNIIEPLQSILRRIVAVLKAKGGPTPY